MQKSEWSDVKIYELLILIGTIQYNLREFQGEIFTLPASPCKVSVEVKFFFQLERLVPGVGGALSFSLTILINCI